LLCGIYSIKGYYVILYYEKNQTDIKESEACISAYLFTALSYSTAAAASDGLVSHY
jgi:hypothetical protein